MPKLAHPAVGIIARAGSTYREVAAATGYCPAWISRVLRRQHPATPEFQRKVADALEKPAHELFDDEDGEKHVSA